MQRGRAFFPAFLCQTVRRRIRMHRGAVRRQGSAAGFSFRRPHVGTRRHLRSGSCVIERQKARRQRKLCIPRRGQYPFYGDGARQKIQQKRRNGERLFCRRTDVCRAEAVSEISGKNLKCAGFPSAAERKLFPRRGSGVRPAGAAFLPEFEGKSSCGACLAVFTVCIQDLRLHPQLRHRNFSARFSLFCCVF